MSEERIIKKYPNRRLYDTTASQYIALDDIRKLVVDGVDFRVADAKSGADITRAILLQIIVEQEEHGQPILSADLLRKIIRFYGDAMQVFMATYLDKSVDRFVDQQAAFYKQMAILMGQAPGAALQDMLGRNLELWQQMQDNLLKAYGFPSKENPSKDNGEA
jgi:polyhydroxyalkanoate synthesis repressor PhaR